jgi:spoIIIJ-associated protein
MDKSAITTTIEEIFKHLDCTVSSCEISEDGGMLWCLIETPDSRFVIGRDGETLRSLTHLVRKIIDTKVTGGATEEESSKLYIDINGYQKKRFDNLKTTAHMMAERARYFKSNIETDPMPAYERRIIHMFLEDAKNIKTESEGQGQNRRVIIKYIEE